MRPRALLSRVTQLIGCVARNPIGSARVSSKLPERLRATAFARDWPGRGGAADHPPRPGPAPNPLAAYFEAHETGRGIWKWSHYFEIYHRHLAKFVGTQVTLAEIGIFSGGSLGMWHDYFGAGCQVVGVDVQEACRAYEDERTRILVGDQGDRRFWRSFREQVPSLDVLIDDGSHIPAHQILTLEEILPHLRPGGVYICEDVHRRQNRFASYAHALADELNEFDRLDQPELAARATGFQSAVHSVHLYPYVVVIEKAAAPVDSFTSPMRGTEWQPFLYTAKQAEGSCDPCAAR